MATHYSRAFAESLVQQPPRMAAHAAERHRLRCDLANRHSVACVDRLPRIVAKAANGPTVVAHAVHP
jgi:hypothetical protein